MKRTWNIVSIGTLVLLFLFSLQGTASTATKDTLIYVMGAEIVSLDPPNQTDSLSMTAIQHIYDLPIHKDSKGTLIPALFTKWEHSNNGKTWTFHLRKGVKFHDGTPFNAEAVKFVWERNTSAKKKVRRRSYFTPWAQNIKVIDEHTIQTTSKKPFAPLLRFFTHGSMAIPSPTALKKYGDQINRNPVGTGPFRFVKWIPGDRLVLERNEDFWGPKPKFKNLIIRFVKESGARVMMLETGEADLILKVPPVDIERLRKNPDIDVLVKPSNRVIGFYVNTSAPLVNDRRFRQALAYAIDKEAIVKHVMKGVAQPHCSVIGGGTFGEAKVKCYEYNVEKAKQLLKETGYKGEKLRLWTPKGRYTMDMETAEAVQGYWQQAGIKVEFRVMEFPTLTRGVRKVNSKYQVVLLGAGPTTLDGDQIMRARYHSGQIPPNGVNLSRYNNPEYDKCAEDQSIELDVEKRKEIMKKGQEILARDLPYIPLYVLKQVVGVRKHVKGVEQLQTEMTIVREAYLE
ncbi:MAG: hypothetical protein JRG73_01390 [Deltaproteobacteria bacterium]|nr:hypothetical protein [Deltaproteobacteria bacterium]MBW2305559.1 hypothetical protein [Deltaproteobacteria bacterium]